MKNNKEPRHEVEIGVSIRKEFDPTSWKPRTELGRLVKEGKFNSLSDVFNTGHRIMESEIIDQMTKNLSSEFLEIGQSKGKFGGGKASIWKQTQKKTAEGNKPKFQTAIVVGNNDGFVGVGVGKAKETVPAREKALRNAKLNMIKIKRGCGSWDCHCRTQHSIPFSVQGKCGSIRILLSPAPKGSGLVAEDGTQKILRAAGIKDIYSKLEGTTASKLNVATACFNALKQLTKIKISGGQEKMLGVNDGKESE